MSKYIDVEALGIGIARAEIFANPEFARGWNNAIEIINNAPAADVVEVRHGRWIRPHWKNSNYCCDCSECGGEAMHRDYQWDKNGIYPICPNCGAYMMGENNGQKR